MTKVFAIFKAKEKKNDKSPDYNISIKFNDKYINVGGAWLREGKGGKYFSCKFSNGYKDYPGFSIVQDSIETSQKVEAEKVGEETKNDLDIPF